MLLPSAPVASELTSFKALISYLMSPALNIQTITNSYPGELLPQAPCCFLEKVSIIFPLNCRHPVLMASPAMTLPKLMLHFL